MSLEMVLEVMRKNVGTARQILANVVRRLPDPSASPASRALEHALVTAPAHIGPEPREKLAALIGRLLS